MRINKFNVFINENADTEQDVLEMKPGRFAKLIEFLESDISTTVEEDMDYYKFSTGLSLGELMHLYTQFGHNQHKAEFTEKLKKQYCAHNKTEWERVEQAAKEIDESLNERILSHAQADVVAKALGISLETDYKPKKKGDFDKFKEQFKSVIPTARFGRNGLILLQAQYEEHDVAVLQLLGIGSDLYGDLEEGKINEDFNIRLSDLVQVSNNSRLTQAVLEAINSKFDAAEKRDFQQWLQLVCK